MLALILALSTFALADDRPNVLFVISDDLNNSLGCYGHREVQSPNVDRLATRGVRFDRAYVQYPVCNPSRTSFLTGLRPERTRVLGNDVMFRTRIPDVVTLPQLFRQNGYFTAGLGKVFHRGLSPDDVQVERDDRPSWDHTFYGETTIEGHKGEGRNLTNGALAWCRWLAAEGGDEAQHDGQLASEAIRLLVKHRDGPFFLALGFYRPHDPFISPKAYFDRYPLDALTLPPRAPDDAGPLPRLALPGGEMRAQFGRFTDVERREFLRAYYAGISFMDAQLGRVLDTLDRLGLSERTIVVFLGDNGYELGVRDWWNKNTLFERSCRVPLIIADPRARARGKESTALVECVDLYPTLADLCGLKTPEGLQGVSLRGLLDDPSGSVKDAAFTTVQRGAIIGLSVRTDRFRYTEWDAGREGAELYDHQADPDEWHNRADDPSLREERAVLARKLQALRKVQ
jgi:uncharacterized sulfatase